MRHDTSNHGFYWPPFNIFIWFLTLVCGCILNGSNTVFSLKWGWICLSLCTPPCLTFSAQGRIGTSQTWFLPLPGPWNSWPELSLMIESRSSCPQRCSQIQSLSQEILLARNWKVHNIIQTKKATTFRTSRENHILALLRSRDPGTIGAISS